MYAAKTMEQDPDEVSRFISLDGLQVAPQNTALLAILPEWGYVNEYQLRGKVGYSELGICTKTAEKRAVVAFANENNTYAYVLLEDGEFLNGSFNLFDDGRFSLT